MRLLIEETKEPFPLGGLAKSVLWSAMWRLEMIVPIRDEVTIPDSIDPLTRTFETGAPGLPDFKMDMPVGWLVTPLEIAEALVKAKVADPHVEGLLLRCLDQEVKLAGLRFGEGSTPTRSDALADLIDRWKGLIAFLGRANQEGGFRVYGP